MAGNRPVPAVAPAMGKRTKEARYLLFSACFLPQLSGSGSSVDAGAYHLFAVATAAAATGSIAKL